MKCETFGMRGLIAEVHGMSCNQRKRSDTDRSHSEYSHHRSKNRCGLCGTAKSDMCKTNAGLGRRGSVTSMAGSWMMEMENQQKLHICDAHTVLYFLLIIILGLI